MNPLLVATIASLLGGSGLLGGYIALKRAPADHGKVIVDAAQGAVVVQSGVIDDLRQQMNDEREECARELQRLRDDQDRVIKMLTEDHQRQLDGCHRRIAKLEKRLTDAGLNGH